MSEVVNNQFIDEIKTFVAFELERLKTSDSLNSAIFGCDLPCLVNDDIYKNNYYSLAKAESYEWIERHKEECRNYWEYELSAFGEHFANPTKSPERFVTFIVMAYAFALLRQTNLIQAYWDEEIVLTDMLIDDLCDQVECIDSLELCA